MNIESQSSMHTMDGLGHVLIHGMKMNVISVNMEKDVVSGDDGADQSSNRKTLNLRFAFSSMEIYSNSQTEFSSL